MIGWAVPKPARKPRNARESAVQRSTERKAIKTYMARGEEYDAMNLKLADEWLQQRAEFGEDDYRTVFAMNVMARLRPDLEF
jgi:hypothetical protein